MSIFSPPAQRAWSLQAVLPGARQGLQHLGLRGQVWVPKSRVSPSVHLLEHHPCGPPKAFGDSQGIPMHPLPKLSFCRLTPACPASRLSSGETLCPASGTPSASLCPVQEPTALFPVSSQSPPVLPQFHFQGGIFPEASVQVVGEVCLAWQTHQDITVFRPHFLPGRCLVPFFSEHWGGPHNSQFTLDYKSLL